MLESRGHKVKAMQGTRGQRDKSHTGQKGQEAKSIGLQRSQRQIGNARGGRGRSQRGNIFADQKEPSRQIESGLKSDQSGYRQEAKVMQSTRSQKG